MRGKPDDAGFAPRNGGVILNKNDANRFSGLA